MFEYLMPRLLLRDCPARSCRERPRRRWHGRSSTAGSRACRGGSPNQPTASQYVEGDYQYQAFGVPGLGLKRGLGRDLVVAPYATAMAAMISPREASGEPPPPGRRRR